MAHKNPKVAARERRKLRLRKKIRGSDERPRLSVFCSGRHVYAQIISDEKGVTLAAASTLTEGVKEDGKALANIEGAKRVGSAIAKLALERNLTSVVFDRNGYLYHGKVKALADAAREAGLQF